MSCRTVSTRWGRSGAAAQDAGLGEVVPDLLASDEAPHDLEPVYEAHVLERHPVEVHPVEGPRYEHDRPVVRPVRLGALNPLLHPLVAAAGRAHHLVQRAVAGAGE